MTPMYTPAAVNTAAGAPDGRDLARVRETTSRSRSTDRRLANRKENSREEEVEENSRKMFDEEGFRKKVDGKEEEAVEQEAAAPERISEGLEEERSSVTSNVGAEDRGETCTRAESHDQRTRPIDDDTPASDNADEQSTADNGGTKETALLYRGGRATNNTTEDEAETVDSRRRRRRIVKSTKIGTGEQAGGKREHKPGELADGSAEEDGTESVEIGDREDGNASPSDEAGPDSVARQGETFASDSGRRDQQSRQRANLSDSCWPGEYGPALSHRASNKRRHRARKKSHRSSTTTNNNGNNSSDRSIISAKKCFAGSVAAPEVTADCLLGPRHGTTERVVMRTGPDPAEAESMLETLADLSTELRRLSCAESADLAIDTEAAHLRRWSRAETHDARERFEPDIGAGFCSIGEGLPERVAALEEVLVSSAALDRTATRCVLQSTKYHVLSIEIKSTNWYCTVVRETEGH